MTTLDRLKEFTIFTIGAPVVLGLWVVCTLALVFTDVEFERGEND